MIKLFGDSWIIQSTDDFCRGFHILFSATSTVKEQNDVIKVSFRLFLYGNIMSISIIAE